MRLDLLGLMKMELFVLAPSVFPRRGGVLRNMAFFAAALFLTMLLMLAFKICQDAWHAEFGLSAAHRMIFAAEQGDKAMFAAVKNQGKTISDKRIGSAAVVAYTPLMGAALNGRDEMVKFLLDEGVDLNKREWFGHTALMLAVKSGSVGAVRQLLDAGADVHTGNVYGHTALMFAAMRGRTDMAELLLDAGADVNAVDKAGWPALGHAAQRGHVDAVKFLLSRGAKPLAQQ